MTLPKGYGSGRKRQPPPPPPKDDIKYGRFGGLEIFLIVLGIATITTTMVFGGEEDASSSDGIIIMPSSSSSVTTNPQPATSVNTNAVTTTEQDIDISGEDYALKTYEGGKIVSIRWFNSEGRAWYDSNRGQWSNGYYPVVLGQSGSVYYRCDGICPTSHEMEGMRPRIMSVSGLTWIDCNGGQCHYVYPDGRRVLVEE